MANLPERTTDEVAHIYIYIIYNITYYTRTIFTICANFHSSRSRVIASTITKKFSGEHFVRLLQAKRKKERKNWRASMRRRFLSECIKLVIKMKICDDGACMCACLTLEISSPELTGWMWEEERECVCVCCVCVCDIRAVMHIFIIIKYILHCTWREKSCKKSEKWV